MDEWVISIMGSKLPPRSPAGFSKTARSRPRHGEAVRNGLRVGPLAVLGGRLAQDRAEGAAEAAEAREAHVEADLGDAAIRVPEQEHGALDPPALKVAVRRLAEGVAEAPAEVRRRHMRDPREARYVERLRVAAVHLIARPEDPPVGVLDRPGHPAGSSGSSSSSVSSTWSATAVQSTACAALMSSGVSPTTKMSSFGTSHPSIASPRSTARRTMPGRSTPAVAYAPNVNQRLRSPRASFTAAAPSPLPVMSPSRCPARLSCRRRSRTPGSTR